MSQKQLFRSFAGGEITPEAIGRLDLAKFQTGLALAKNFVTLPHGPAKRRRGFRFINEAKDSRLHVRLIPFQFSATQAVVVELTHLFARFYVDGAAVLEANKACSVSGATVTCTAHGYAIGRDVYIGGRFLRVATTTTNTFTTVDRWGAATNPPASATTCAVVYEIATPYASDKLFGLHYAQDSDVITITHPEYAARELRRLGAASWTLTEVDFTPAVPVPTGLAVTPTIGTAGNESPQSYVITAIDADGVTESLACAPVSTSNNLAVSGNYNTIDWDDISASAYNVYKARGGAYGFIGQTTGLSIVDDNVLPDTTKTPPQDIYELNTATGKYPTAVTYHEQRRWFAGTANEPQTVWATRNGTESNLTTSTPSQDDDGLKFRVRARQQNAIRHLVPLSDLIALTVGGEFRIFSDGSPAITPTTLSTKSQGSQGSSDVQPVTTSGSILYMEATGNRVREMAFQWQNEKFASIDISIMAPHLFDGYTIVDLAFQRSPVPTCWCVRSDGVLLGMTYVPEQQVYGWHQHHTLGDVESVCVVVESGEDVLYLMVRRTIDGRTVRYLERLESEFLSTAAAQTGGDTVCLDGPEWSTKTLPKATTYAAKSVAAGNGIVVAVSNDAGKPYAVYSLDNGETWAAGTVTGFSPGDGGGYAPSYGGGWFFAMVNAVKGMRSSNGVNWDAVNITSTIADNTGYALGRHFAIGISKTNGIIWSADGGENWTSVLSTNIPVYAAASTGLATNGTVAMFCGSDGSGGYAITTTTGDTWTRKSAPWGTKSPNCVLCDGSRFVVFGNSNVPDDSAWYSDDAGDTWIAIALAGTGAGTNVWRDGVFNAGTFLAVADGSTDVSLSHLGTPWSLSGHPMVTGGAGSVAATGMRWVAQLIGSRSTIRVGVCAGTTVPPDESASGDGRGERIDFYVDSGLTYRGAPADTISGLYHLEGQAVQILADGAVLPNDVVENGALTLDSNYSVVHVGLGYTSDFKTLPMALEAQAFGQGTLKNINGLRVRMVSSSVVKAGPTFERLITAPERAVTDNYDSPPALHTYEARFAIGGKWDPDAAICVRQDLPLPLTVAAIVPDVATGG